MFPAASLLATLLLALSVAASTVQARSPSITLPFAKRINTNGGAVNLVQQDRARAAALKQRAAAVQSGNLHRRDTASSTVDTGLGPLSPYIAQVGIGSPPTNYTLIVDTGCSNTFVGAKTPYQKTGSSVNTGQPVALSWGPYNFTDALEWVDAVTISPDLVISQQSIGVIGKTNVIPCGADGTLGIGTEAMTLVQGNLIDEPNVEIPTVTHNLYVQGKIPEEVVSMYCMPTAEENSVYGEVTFGSIDPSNYIGEIGYVPITSTSPSSYFWGFNQTITYGSTTVLSNTAGITDSGTTLIIIASEAYAVYKSVTGAVEEDGTNLLKLTPSQYDKLENLNFHMGPETFVLTPDGQIWPRALNSYIGGSKGSVYLIVSNIGTPYGMGYDFVNGVAFLDRFYSVYDSANQRVGFAKTKYTDAIIN